jgi:molybdopterin molybdotransferase
MHPDDAIRLIESLDVRLPSETVSLADALGRVPVLTPVTLLDQPPFDKSTMDGFAYASAEENLADTGDSFILAGTAAAGSPPRPPLAAGECLRIMTGAPLPKGTFAVHRLERSEVSDGRVRILAREDEVNIARRGANSREGEELFPLRPLRPQDIALLAANGIANIEVIRRPRVRVLSTGNELRAAGQSLCPGLIYDSNGPQLVAQAAAFGCDAIFGGIVSDDEDALRDAIVQAAEHADLVIASGGVSAGDLDFVPMAMERAGFSALFRALAMRPGMPALLCRRGAVFAYGMPGNPVSSFVNFELVVKPLLMRFSGLRYEPRLETARMGKAVSRRDAGKIEFLPVRLEGGIAYPLRYTGSTMLDVLARADALIRLEAGQCEAAEGTEVHARRI